MFKSTLTLIGLLALAGAADANENLNQPEALPTVIAGAENHDAAAMQAANSESASYVAGDLVISHPFSRATLPNAPVAGGFFTVKNNGAADDRLIGASSDVADRLEIHEMAMDGDIMRMRQLKDGLPLPAGETVELKPGGYHIMFMGLNQPLIEGETVNVILVFEKAGEIEIPLPIGAPNAKGDAGMHHGGMKMKQGALGPLPCLPVQTTECLSVPSLAGTSAPALKKAAA